MAVRVRINNFVAYRKSIGEARELVDDVLSDVKRLATVILATGPYTEGKLVHGLESEVTVHGTEITGRVGIRGRRFPYASAVEGGARDHTIRANPPRRYLRFYWAKVGDVVYFRQVHHPGQRGKGYLRGPLVVAAQKHGMRVITHR